MRGTFSTSTSEEGRAPKEPFRFGGKRGLPSMQRTSKDSLQKLVGKAQRSVLIIFWAPEEETQGSVWSKGDPQPER